MKMVLVFHLNRRLVQYKLLIFSTILLVMLVIFIHTFELSYHLINNCPYEETIDVVYTWVNGSDPRFLKHLNSYLRKHARDQIDSSTQRFDDKNELRFSLRSLEKFAPWIGKVYIVTNGQIPYWLNLDYEKVRVVTHKEIFTDLFDLPTFSSPAIESHLHRIPGLSKRFIYFNDDVFLQSPIYKDDFISESRGFLIYLAWLMPMCSLECSWLYVADGHCDSACNNLNCQMDGGDCDDSSKMLLGDVIIKSEDYEVQETKMKQFKDVNYGKILLSLQNTSHQPLNFNSIQNFDNVSELIAIHNRKIILLDKLKRRKMRKKLSLDFHYINKMRNRNRNVDAYAASLQHTNRILNKYYGFSVRKVPAHAPIMIDKDIMERLQTKFVREFKTTSGNRVRSTDDMQFAFVYYYYIIHEKIELSADEIFDHFDTDSSGIWSETEIRTVLTRLYDLPVSDETIDQLTKILINCSSKPVYSELIITKKLVTNCPQLLHLLKTSLAVKRKYKFEIIKDAEKKHVSFKMLNSNVTQVMIQLDDVRKNVKKFVCLNDNLDQSRSFNNQVVKRVMFDFYVSLFPAQSKFELPEEYKNRFLHMDDYNSMLNEQKRKVTFVCMALMLTVFVLFLHFCKRKICKMINKMFF